MCREALKHYLAGSVSRGTGGTGPLRGRARSGRPAAIREARARTRCGGCRCATRRAAAGPTCSACCTSCCGCAERLFATQSLDAVTLHPQAGDHPEQPVRRGPRSVRGEHRPAAALAGLAVEFQGETPPPLPNLDFKIEAATASARPTAASCSAARARFACGSPSNFRKRKQPTSFSWGGEKGSPR